MIYLDNNATTIIDAAVVDAMLPLLQQGVGNPSSIHRLGQKAKGMLVEASRYCARFFGVKPEEIIFTSGATEGLNFLIRSLPPQSHIVTSALEHSAILEPLKISGCCVSYLSSDKGAISAAQIAHAIQNETRAVILTAANNETGIITSELEEIAEICERANALLIVDGVAYLGKGLPPLPKKIAAACFSGHKIHGPLGIGLVIVRKPFKPHPFILGGSQQYGLRGGTENLPAIIGFVRALQLLQEGEFRWAQTMETLRDRFEQGLLKNFPKIIIYGKGEKRLCSTSQIAFPDIDGATLLMALDLAGVAASHGSACASGTQEPSRVLLNMGIAPKMVRSSLRFSLSRITTQDEIDRAILLISQTLQRLQRTY
jgi:cysteine desulfurase